MRWALGDVFGTVDVYVLGVTIHMYLSELGHIFCASGPRTTDFPIFMQEKSCSAAGGHNRQSALEVTIWEVSSKFDARQPLSLTSRITLLRCENGPFFDVILHPTVRKWTRVSQSWLPLIKPEVGRLPSTGPRAVPARSVCA